jgi:hypothetical protein
MSHKKNKLLAMTIFTLGLWASALFGQGLEISMQRASASTGNFVLTVEANRLSLEAQDASLLAILEEIGRKMHIEVLGEIPAQETITAEFHNLPLEEALHQLSSNFGYQMKSEKGGQEISKIFVLPKGTGTNTRPTTKEVEPRKEIVTPESEPILEAEGAKENESDKEKPTRPEPFKFQFDPSALIGK